MSLSTNANQSVKHRQITHLAAQLAVLAQRTEHLEQLTISTAEQASYMRLLGAYHASWFMSASRILTPNEPAPQQQPAQGHERGQEQ